MVLVGSVLAFRPPEAAWRLLRTITTPIAIDVGTSMRFGGRDKAILNDHPGHAWWIDLRTSEVVELAGDVQASPNLPDRYFIPENPTRLFDFDTRRPLTKTDARVAVLGFPVHSGDVYRVGHSVQLVWWSPKTQNYLLPKPGVDGADIAVSHDPSRIPTRGDSLTTTATHFDGLVGDPDAGPFAIYFANTRTGGTAGAFDGRGRPVTVWAKEICDAGSNGFIGMSGDRDMGGYLDATELMCADANGRTRWTKAQWKGYHGDHPQIGSPKWIGRDVRTATEILSGRDGHVLARWRPPAGSRILGWSRDVCWTESIPPSRRLIAWRLLY